MNSTRSPFKAGSLQFGLGTSSIASLGRRLDFKIALSLFDTAFKDGINVIDTADAYGSGDSEFLIGEILEKLNAHPFIITKAGLPYTSLPNWASPLNQVIKKAKHRLSFKKQFSSEYIINALHKSLKRLKKKQVGALLLHELTESDINSYDCWETIEEVKKTGLASFTGISSNEPVVVKEAILSGRVEIVETKLQYGDENSGTIIKLCRENKIPCVANEIMGIYKSGTYNFENIISEVRHLNGLEKIQPAQLVIGMVYCDTKADCILLGTTNPEHLLENINSKDFIPVITENFTLIKKIFSDNRK